MDLFMKDKIYISYIIPCYNIQDYLNRCLDSLTSQEIGGNSDSIEFIFINDGSTDNTLSILKEFAVKEKRAKVIDQKNQGVSAARNAGLKVANGKYVFFLDSDDFLTSEASQYIYEACVGCNPEIIIANAFYVKENINEGKTEWNVCQGLIPGIYPVRRFVDLVNTLPVSFKAYRRDFLLQNNITYDEDLKVGEVYTFFLNCLAKADTVAFTDNRIMNYLVRNGSVMREYNVKRDSQIINTIQRIDSYASLYEFDLRNKRSYNKSFYNIVNMFSFNKYYSGLLWNNDVICFLKSIKRNDVYKKVLKFLLRDNWGINKITIKLAVMYYLPVRISYRLFRLYKIIFN